MPALPLHGMSTARQKTGLCRRREGSSASSVRIYVCLYESRAEFLSCDLLTFYQSGEDFQAACHST